MSNDINLFEIGDKAQKRFCEGLDDTCTCTAIWNEFDQGLVIRSLSQSARFHGLFPSNSIELETLKRELTATLTYFNLQKQGANEMTWIKTVPMSQAGDRLRDCLEEVMQLYPPEYGVPVEAVEDPGDQDEGASIMMSHSLIPEALKNAFSTYGTLLSPELPLSRRQHELIAATVSALNDCFY